MKSPVSTLNRKKHGQGMVEFALVLPLLLLVVMGIIEVGRLMFIYSAMTSASREAARYGSAVNDASGTNQYKDCPGIRAAAKRVGSIAGIQDGDITIEYDDGPGSTSYDSCPPSQDVDLADRITVTVTTRFRPITPLVNLPGFDMTSTTSRTILKEVVPEGVGYSEAGGENDDGEGEEEDETAAMTFTKSASPGTYSCPSESIEYTFTINNTGDVSLDYEVIDDMFPSMSCSGTLASGEETSCEGEYEYTTTADDVTAGSIENTAAAADSGEGLTETSSATVDYEAPSTSLSLVSITASPTVSTTLGDTITYTYEIKNESDSPFQLASLAVNDDTATTDCSGATDPLPVGDTTTCTGTYEITQPDLDAGSVINEATALAEDCNGTTVTSNSATTTVVTKPLLLAVSASPEDDYDNTEEDKDEVEYIYTLENVGETDLSNFSVVDDTSSVTCLNSGITLSPGETTDCTATHTITQDDMDLGELTNEATGYADNGAISSNTVETTVTADQEPALSLEITDPENETNIASTPDLSEIEYTYQLTNSGNVTLTQGITVLNSNGDEVCDVNTDLAPNASVDCTYTYPINDPDDWDAGSITQTVHADTDFIDASGDTVDVHSDEVSVIVYTYDGDRITLEATSEPEGYSGPDGDPSVAIGNQINFTYVLKNTGSTVLDEAYTLTSSLTDDVGCPTITYETSPGDTIMTCSNVPYTVDTNDVNDSGDQITNTVTATASDGAVESNTETISFNIDPCNFISSVSTSMETVDKHDRVLWEIENNGPAFELRSVTIVWPRQNKNSPTLTEITFGDASIWAGSVDPDPAGTHTASYPEDFTGITLPGNQSKEFVFEFDKNESLVYGDHELEAIFEYGATSCTVTVTYNYP